MTRIARTVTIERAKIAAVVLALLLFAAALARAEIGDPTIRTNHPHYAGEGAFQSIEDCVEFATSAAPDTQDKAIALYLWLLTHQWHLASPQEFSVPGAQPDTQRTSAYELMVMDANRGRFSYGYGLCGTVHAWNEPYWKALGMNARRRAFPGHTNSEVQYGNGWHAFDTDMAGLIFRPDGVVAGYDDVVQNPRIATAAKPPLPCYPFAWPSDYQAMQAGWREVAKGGHWYSMYHGGYAAHPGAVHLRRGEKLTRYFSPDSFGGPSKRRFWHHQPGGPFRDWTFTNQGTPRHEGETSNSRGNASYCNGVFEYEPDLTRATIKEELAETSSNVVIGRGSPRLHSSNGKDAFVTFGHFSPYVICGDPADDANPMTASASDGLRVAGKAIGHVRLSISADEGQTWQPRGVFHGEFELDLTDQVKGRYGWRAKFDWNGSDGLDAVRFITTTQVSHAIYPRLKPGGTRVSYRAGSQAVVPVLPNWSLSEGELQFERTAMRSKNVAYSPRTASSRYAYRTRDNQPGSVVFAIAAQSELVEIAAAVRFGVTTPPPPDCRFYLEFSMDSGESWRQLAEAVIPPDNEFSSGWMFGRAKIDRPASRLALVRAHFFNGGKEAGLIDAQLYGLRRTGLPQAARLTYGWLEANQRRTSSQVLLPGVQEHDFEVPTGASIVDDFVQIAAVE